MQKRNDKVIDLTNPGFDTVTYNKIQRHLNDINDVITEEDIRNIKLFVAHPDMNDVTLKEMDQEFIEGRKINSAWNIVSE